VAWDVPTPQQREIRELVTTLAPVVFTWDEPGQP
jgi:hypothetical protein